MQISYSPSPHNRVDYYPLPNGYADVFLHRNEIEEVDEEGSLVYVAEEIYFQIDESITKEQIEQNFEYMWQDAERQVPKMSTMGIMKTLELEEPTFWDYIKGYLTTAFSTTSGKVQVVDENEDVKGAGYYNGILNSLIDIKDSIDISTGKLTRMVGYNENVVSGTVINYSDMADGGQFIAYNADGTQYVGIKGDALAVDASKLTYQLAEPIVTNIPAQMLTGGPGYTFMWLPEVPDAGVYNNGISILREDLPIKALKKLSKIDFMTGEEIELDTTAAVIAGDKKSFTHPDLTNDDIVFFEYEYPSELTTVPELEVGYLDSRYVVEDTENGKLYSWKIVSTNGVGSLVLTEVV